MLPKKFRLTKADNFRRIYKLGFRYKGRYFSACYIKNTQNALKKLAVVVSKRVASKAHDRNLLKRRFLANISHFFTNKTNTNIFCIITILSQAKQATFMEIKNDLLHFFEKIANISQK